MKTRTGAAGVCLLALLASGCVKRTLLNYNAEHGSVVSRDRLVDSWDVNGERVEGKFLAPEPGCYALSVKYREIYSGFHDPGSALPTPFPRLNAMVGAAQIMAAAYHKEYESGTVAFALEVKPKYTYWVTATFNGDEFFGRIVETNEQGERVGQIDPASTSQVLLDCVSRNKQAAAAKYP